MSATSTRPNYPAKPPDNAADLRYVDFPTAVVVKKSTFFAQSDVPQVTELCWVLNTASARSA